MALRDEYRDYPTTSTAAFGRVFYGQENRILFSQIFVDDVNSLGRCYQRNDPTSAQLSDVLPTDGGEVTLQNSGRILRIEEYQRGIIAFAERGVWYIYGPDSGFTATNYTQTKITEFPLYSTLGVVNVGDVIYYIAENGIYAVNTNEFGRVVATNITEATIDSYYLDFVSKDISGIYDPVRKQIWYVNASTDEALVQDLRSQGFYPQKFELTNDQDIPVTFRIEGEDLIYYTLEDTGTGYYNLLQLTDPTFEDLGTPFTSYVVTFEESLGKFSHRKSVPNIYLFFNKTEDNITGFDGTSYTFDNPSGCQFRAEFDYTNSTSANKYTQYRQVYRVNTRGYLLQSPTYPQPFDDGQSVVTYRDMIRGNGKSVRFRFQSEDNKDMQLLGYNVEYSMRGRQ